MAPNPKDTRALEEVLGAIIGVILGLTLRIVVLAFIVKITWNAVMPAVFELHPITFWQALALQLLAYALVAIIRKKR